MSACDGIGITNSLGQCGWYSGPVSSKLRLAQCPKEITKARTLGLTMIPLCSLGEEKKASELVRRKQTQLVCLLEQPMDGVALSFLF